MQSNCDICIIGNGAIGKAAALGFAQAGASVTLLDALVAPVAAAAPRHWDQRVYALNPLARALLTRLRVWDALDASRVTAVDAMVIEGDTDAHAGRLEFDSYAARADALAWIVEDSNLNHALDSALKFAANVRRVQGTADAMQCDAVTGVVTLADGERIAAELIVGADGAQSWVRAQTAIGIDYRPYGQRAVVANFTCEKPHRGVARQWFSATEGIVALLPLAGDRVSLVWSAPDSLAATLLDDTAEAFAARVSAYCQASLGTLAPLDAAGAKAFTLAMLRPHAITAPRVALIGDAAHVVHPLAGQGMNPGFADVDALLQVVAERGAHRDRGDVRVLARYARERKESILLMHLATDGLQRLFATDIEPLRIARNIGLDLINRLPFLKRQLITQAIGNKT
ncbi:MAG: FAD-dependent monooxygenase [Herminiimonas sp.]|nr:FAD-dependent monooxygenase [Herminiimonas sp.]